MTVRRIGALAGVVGPSMFMLVFLIEGLMRPGYDPLADYVSALSLGPRGWVQITSFLVTGVCLLLFTATVARQFPTGAASRAGPVLLGVIGAGYLLSGPFVMDPTGTLQTQMSPHGLVHAILGAIVFLAMPIVCFVYLRRFRQDPRLRPLTWPTVVLGAIAGVTDIVFSIVTKVPDLASATSAWAGLLQRMVITPFMIWVVFFAVRLLPLSRNSPRGDRRPASADQAGSRDPR